MKTKFILSLFLLTSCIFSSYASGPHSEVLSSKFESLDSEEHVETKYYIHQENLYIQHNEIIVLLDDDYISLTKIRVDENGLYFIKEDVEAACWNGHYTTCSRCGGCSIIWCPGRCKCFG